MKPPEMDTTECRGLWNYGRTDFDLERSRVNDMFRESHLQVTAQGHLWAILLRLVPTKRLGCHCRCHCHFATCAVFCFPQVMSMVPRRETTHARRAMLAIARRQA